ncbi:MAG: protein phosphatase 2C domain-containing protein [Chthoniobacterales bacterium]
MLERYLRWSGTSDRGRFRANNEDAFLGLQFDGREAWRLGKLGEAALAQRDAVFAVSDGMGGAEAGEFASRIVVEKITKLMPKSFRISAAGVDAGLSDVLTELFLEIHNALTFLGVSYEECRGMGATLSLAWFTPEWMYFAHVGDSRIYYLPKSGGIRQVTQDDSHVGWLLRQGQINEREARNHPRRSVLQKALGAGNHSVEPQLGRIGLERGDRFLLCTDGVTDGLFDARLLEFATETNERDVASRLVAAAVQASGKDNATAVVVEVEAREKD